MKVTKRIDLGLLQRELEAASVVVAGLSLLGLNEDGSESDVIQFLDDRFEPVDLPPEAQPVLDAHDASKPQRATAFEAAEDAERLRIVAERARTDPAFAALSELALKGVER